MQDASDADHAPNEPSEEATAAAFLKQLLTLADRDVCRAEAKPEDTSARSVALWMAGEIERHAVEQGLAPSAARELRDHASALRKRVRSASKRSA